MFFFFSFLRFFLLFFNTVVPLVPWKLFSIEYTLEARLTFNIFIFKLNIIKYLYTAYCVNCLCLCHMCDVKWMYENRSQWKLYKKKKLRSFVPKFRFYYFPYIKHIFNRCNFLSFLFSFVKFNILFVFFSRKTKHNLPHLVHEYTNIRVVNCFSACLFLFLYIIFDFFFFSFCHFIYTVNNNKY